MTNPWDIFWLREVPPHALAFTRICLGIFLLVYAGLYVPHLTVMFSNEGLVLPLYIDSFPALSAILAPPSPAAVYCIYSVLLLSILGILTGTFFRVSTASTMILAMYFWQLQLHLFPTSYNRILMLCLLVLLCSGAHRTWSVDEKLRTGSAWNWEPISILPQRLLTIQITCTFLGVSIQKWWLPDWQGGEVLAYSYIGRWGTPLAWWYIQLPWTMLHYDIVVWAVKILQPLCAVGLWIPRFRTPSILLLSLFLLLVSVMLSIWWFVFLIPAFFLFYEPKTVLEYFQKSLRSSLPKYPVQQTK